MKLILCADFARDERVSLPQNMPETFLLSNSSILTPS